MTLIEALSGAGLRRPATDPGVAAHIRAELETAAGPAPAGGLVLRVTKSRLRQVLVCERHLVACLGASDVQTPELVAGRLLDQLFALAAVGHPLGSDLVVYALDAAAAAGDSHVAPAWEALSPEEKEEATAIVGQCSPALVAWPVVPGKALIRLQEPLLVELAGGRVVLAGRVDLVLGRPGVTVAGSTLVDVKSGRHRHDDVIDAGWYAILETLRHRAAPFQVGSYYLRDGRLELKVVTPDMLIQATARIAQGLSRLVRLAQGAVPEATPNPLCPWCPAIDRCQPGRRFSSERGDLVPVVAEDSDAP